MKNNKNIGYFIFAVLMFFISIEGVWAATGRCSYKSLSKSGKVIDIEVEIDASTGDVKKAKCGMEGWGTCQISDDRKANFELFIVEDGTLYCPKTLYTEKTAGQYYGFFRNKNGNVANLVSNNGSSQQYEDPNLDPCKLGGKAAGDAAVDSLKKIVIPSGSSITISEVESIRGEVEKICETVDNEKNNFCNTSTLKDANKLANEILDKLKEAAQESEKLSNDEKAQAAQDIAAAKNKVDLSLGKVGSVAQLGNDVVCFVDGLLSPELKEVLQFIMNIIRIAVPILLIVLVAADFGSAVLSNDKEITSKVTSKVVKRFIAALVVFFIPTIVGLLLDMPGISDWTSTDAACVEKLSEN